MNKPNDGGPAFPFHYSVKTELGRVDTWENDGMSLRDYFAAAALTGYCSDRFDPHAAHQAYLMADAMLAERAKGQPAPAPTVEQIARDTAANVYFYTRNHDDEAAAQEILSAMRLVTKQAIEETGAEIALSNAIADGQDSKERWLELTEALRRLRQLTKGTP